MMMHWHSKADAARQSAELELQLDLLDYIASMAEGRVVARDGRVTHLRWPRDRLETASFHVVQPHQRTASALVLG
jgi:hypothetical protein